MRNEETALELKPILKKFATTQRYQAEPKEMTHLLKLKNAHLKVLITSIGGEKEQGKFKVNHLNLEILVKTPLVSASESVE